MRRNKIRVSDMKFHEKLAQWRKAKNLTQVELAKKIGIGIAQMRRYEAGRSWPTLPVIQKMAQALGVSADTLIFDREDRIAAGHIPDPELLEKFAAVCKLAAADRQVIKVLLEGMLIRHQVQAIASAPAEPPRR